MSEISDLCATYQTVGRIDDARALLEASRATLIQLKGLVEADIAIIKAQIEAGREHHPDPDWHYKVWSAKGHKLGLIKRIEAALLERKLEHMASLNQRRCGLLMKAIDENVPEELRKKIFEKFNQLCEEEP